MSDFWAKFDSKSPFSQEEEEERDDGWGLRSR